jgi:hypothetical protein
MPVNRVISETLEMSAFALPIFADLSHSTDAVASRVDAKRVAKVRIASKWIAAIALAPTLPHLFRTAKEVGRVIEYLNSKAADELSEKELREIAHLINQCHGRMQKVLTRFKSLGLSGLVVYASILSDVEQKSDHLASIGEGINMSLNGDFRSLVELGLEELESAKVKRPTVEHVQA